MKNRAFTLIELLIVVAIIAILALIAVPNFLEAQTRAKVSRTETDLRTIAVGLEAYAIDHNMYPPTPNTAGYLRYARLAQLTTPIPYITTVLFDPFFMSQFNMDIRERAYPLWDPEQSDVRKDNPGGVFAWMPAERSRRGRWTLHGAGPDQDYEAATDMGGTGKLHYYDPTNGSVSSGDCYRFGP